MNKCVIILSDKSSGSSILQNVLAKHPEIDRIKETEFNFESKYWAYATAILGLPQSIMEYSYEFPIKRKKALKALNKLFSDLDIDITLDIASVQKEDIFRGWRLLCERFAPVFLEKSPHHLHYWEALKLMIEFCEKHGDIEVKFIGLIRNPMDTLYSMWKRWYAIPERRQHEWLRAYENLLKLESMVKKQLLIIKYEDLIEGKDTLKTVFEFIGVKYAPDIETNIHNKSLQKWKSDKHFGFQLDKNVFAFAERFYPGYSLQNEHEALWRFIEVINEPRFRLLVTKGKLIRILSKLKHSLLNQ